MHAQQHPGRIAPGVLPEAGERHRPVAVALVAEELAVGVEARGPEADAALKVVVDGDAHGGRVPPVALLVLHGGAVARAGQEAAGLVGIGVVFRQTEGAERAFAHIDAVGIGVVLGARGGVLEIVLPAVLVHPGALDVGPVAEHPADQRLDIGGQQLLRHGPVAPQRPGIWPRSPPRWPGACCCSRRCAHSRFHTDRRRPAPSSPRRAAWSPDPAPRRRSASGWSSPSRNRPARRRRQRGWDPRRGSCPRSAHRGRSGCPLCASGRSCAPGWRRRNTPSRPARARRARSRRAAAHPAGGGFPSSPDRPTPRRPASWRRRYNSAP